jgi:hypothetical protein
LIISFVRRCAKLDQERGSHINRSVEVRGSFARAAVFPFAVAELHPVREVDLSSGLEHGRDAGSRMSHRQRRNTAMRKACIRAAAEAAHERIRFYSRIGRCEIRNASA